MKTTAVKKEPSMASEPLRRQVLVLSDDVSLRNLFYLMRKLASENAADGSEKAVAAIIEHDQYDAVVLDLRCSDQQHKGEIHGIGKIQPVMMGRLLTITAEVNGPQTLDLVERYLITGLPGALLWLVSHRYIPRRLESIH
jgi:hypothetical protein